MFCLPFLWWCSFVLCTSSLTSLASAQTETVTLTSSVEENRKQAACPGEVVTFTCMVTDGVALEWIAEPYIDPGKVVFLLDSDNGTMKNPTAQIHVVLDAVSPASGPHFRNFISFLVVNDSSTIGRIVIQCNNGDPNVTANNTLTAGTSPSVPQNTNNTSPMYSLSNFTTVVQWESPANDGGLGIDNYTLTGAGITAPLTVLSNESLMATLILSYNETHMVSITASNCAGESNASVVTIHEVGCGPPTPPPRGSLGDLTSSQEGAVVTFQCSPGLVPSQQMMSVCMANGYWTPDPAELVCRADCEIPIVIDGSVNYTTTVEGSTATYQCDTGLIPVGVTTAVCMESGEWAPDPTERGCRLPAQATCGVPPSPSNGFVNFTNVIEGSEVTFRCASGTEMTAVCTVHGEWLPNPGDLDCNNDTTAGTPSIQVVVIAVPVVVVGGVAVAVAVVVMIIIWRKRRSSGGFDVKATATEIVLDSTYDYARVTASVRLVSCPESHPSGNETSVSLEMDLLPKNGFYDQPDIKKPPPEKFEDTTYDDPDSKKPPPLPEKPGLHYAVLQVDPAHIPPPAPPAAVQYSQIVAQSVPIDIIHPADKLLNLDTALAQLKEVQESWYELGTGLGVPATTLDDIKSQCPSSQDCLIETVDSWMRGHTGTPTWRIVTAVLRQIDFQSLAASIDQVYVTGELPTPFDNRVPSSSLGSPGSPRGFGIPESPPPPIPARMNSLEEEIPPKPPRYRGGQESRPPPLPSRMEPEPDVPPRPPKSSKSPPPKPVRSSRRRTPDDAPLRPPKPDLYHVGQ